MVYHETGKDMINLLNKFRMLARKYNRYWVRELNIEVLIKNKNLMSPIITSAFWS